MRSRTVARSRPLLVLVLAAAATAPALGQRWTATRTLWETSLGPPLNGEGVILRLAACAGGGSYLTDAAGGLWRLEPNGQALAARAGIEGLVGVTAIACDPEARLVAAGAGVLLRFPADASGVPQRTSLRSVRSRPSRIALIPEGGFAITSADSESRLLVYSARGELTREIREPRLPVPESARRVAARGSSLVWDRLRRRLVSIPLNPFEPRSYDLDGRLLASGRPTVFQPLRTLEDSGAVLPPDEVMFAAFLPDGTLAVHVFEGRDSEGGYRRDGRLYLLGTDFAILERLTLPPGSGVLQGAADDGTLYFVRANVGKPARVAAVRLVE